MRNAFINFINIEINPIILLTGSSLLKIIFVGELFYVLSRTFIKLSAIFISKVRSVHDSSYLLQVQLNLSFPWEDPFPISRLLRLITHIANRYSSAMMYMHSTSKRALYVYRNTDRQSATIGRFKI